MSTITFEGSRNYVDEHVSNFIWEEEPGTRITIDIMEDKCKVVKETKEQVRGEAVQTVNPM